MKPKSVVGMLGVVAMALLLSPTWAAAGSATQADTEPALIIIAGVMEFKTSPNVRAQFLSDSSANGDGTGTTYVAGTVHRAGDRSYGVDPDYTGMYVAPVPVGTTDAWAAGTPTVSPGSSGDFTGSWQAK